jgi:heme exporter protein C
MLYKEMRMKVIYALGVVVAALFVRNLHVILNVLPDEINQGAMYRIMFFHIPAWWTAGLALALSAGTSLLYLATGKMKYDAISVSVTEVSVAWLFVGLSTGTIWARIQWGIWWTWDARLTSALVCVLLYCGYRILRDAIDDPTSRARISAAFHIFAFADVPIVWYSIRWWRTQHPQPVTLPPEMWSAIFWNWGALILLMVIMVVLRLRQEEMSREIDGLRRLAHAV